MATEPIVATQSTGSPSLSLSYTVSSSEKSMTAATTTEVKNDSGSEKVSRNSSSYEDDWGELVIDLGNENDGEKNNKDMKPIAGLQNSNNERENVVGNNNNNNSANANSPCSNKHGNSTEKTSSTNKNVSSSCVNKGLSYTQTANLTQSGKNGKSKSKKSSKSTKNHASVSVPNSSSHLSDSRTSSPTVSFNSSGDIISNVNPSKHIHSLDSKMTLSRTSSSPDDVSGKKSKSSKSKSHHKKHSKHGDKSNSGSSGSKSDFSNEKLKSKSKHSNSSNSSSTSVSSSGLGFCTSSGTHNLPAYVSGVSTSITNKPASAFRRSGSPNLAGVSNSQSLSTAQKINQLTNSRRTPTRTALVPSTTSNGAKSTHACSDKDSSANDNSSTASHSTGSHGRKKHKKGQSVMSSNNNEVTDDSQHSQVYSNSQQGNSGKRDRNYNAGSLALSTGETPSTKKIKLDSDTKSNGGSRSSLTCYGTEGGGRSVPQFTNPISDSTRTAAVRVAQSSTMSRPDIGEAIQSVAGNKHSDVSAASVAPPVFAPSNKFAQPRSRFNASGDGEHPSNAVTSCDTSSVWPNSSAYNGDKPRASANTSAASENTRRSVGTITTTANVGVMTEPDALGPCEPGTSVHLDGIVWHETDTGVLVVNVTWRNRTYVGTLLDATKHDWAPPRFSDSDIDMELRGKNGRPKRSRGGANENTRKGRSRGAGQATSDDVKGSPSTAAKRRNKNSESETAANAEDGATTPRSSAKRARLATTRGAKDIAQQLQQLQSERSGNGSNGGSESSACSSPVFIDCPHPKCGKRYKHINGLKYHQAHAHLDFDENEIKDRGDKEEEEESVTDQMSSPHEEESRGSDTEISTSLEDERAKKLASSETSTDASNSTDAAKDTRSSDDSKSEFFSSRMAHSGLSTDSQPPETSKHPPVDKESDRNDTNFTNSLTLQTKIQSFPVYTSNQPQTEFTNSSSAPATADSAPSSTQQTSFPSVTTSDQLLFSGSSTTSAVDNQRQGAESSVVDENAQAVKALLRSQNNDTDILSLPGLSAPYSQDSPHPTLSLASKSGTNAAQSAENVLTSSGYPSSHYPSNHPYPHTASTTGEQVIENTFSTVPLTSRAFPSNTHLSFVSPPTSHEVTLPDTKLYSSSQANTTSSPAVVTTSDHTSFTSRDPGIHEDVLRYSSAAALSKDSYIASVSSHVTNTHGLKMAKGKTVPIPVDPNHGLPSSYAGAANPGGFSASFKKTKRKKKSEGKPGALSTEDARSNDQSFLDQPQSIPEAAPVSSSTSSYSLASTALNNMAASYQNSQKNKNIVLKPNESTVIVTSNAAHVKTETGLRLPPQYVGGRKVPGKVLPVSASQNHFHNNITVSGTFHPHPDPHKPQTAVSAQTQDRIRASRAPSPSNPNPGNKNNNNKLANANSVARGGPGPEQTNQKQKSSSMQSSSPHPEGTIPTDQTRDENFLHQRHSQAKQRLSDPGAVPPDIITMNKIQDKVDNVIANAYPRQFVPRAKASTPVNDAQRQSDSTPRSRPPSVDPRPVIINDDTNRPRPREEAPPVNRSRPVDGTTVARENSPSKVTGEAQYPNNSHAAYISQIQQMYGPHMFQFGINYIHPMDPAYQQAAQAQMLTDPRIRQQYDQYVQEYQKRQLLQQQALSQQQQQLIDKKVRKPEPIRRETPKPEYPPKPAPSSGVESEKSPWPHQHAKRHSTGPPSPFNNQSGRDKPVGGNMPGSSHHQSAGPLTRYKSPQPTPHPIIPAPARCHSVAPVTHSAPSSGSPHQKSDSIDRGRSSVREELRMRKPSTPPVRMDRSPEKPKEPHPSGVYPNPADAPGQIQYFSYPQIFDPSFRGMPYHPVPPSFAPGYVFPSAGGPMFPAQPGWIPGTQPPVGGKQSPSMKPGKDRPPSRPRSPSREDHSRVRPDSKSRDPGMHFPMKDRRSMEIPNLPARKLSRSPDQKALVPISVPSRNSVSGAPPSVDQRPPSPPTQRHLHTHHHIHENLLIQPHQYAYPPPSVITGSEVTSYAVPYQKRD